MKPDDELTNRTVFDDVRRILAGARRQAYAAANFAMVEAYWQIGRRIVEEELAGQQRAEYGLYLTRELSRRLGDEFGKGFSVANLSNFKKFYLMFPDREIRYTLCNELTEPAPEGEDAQKPYTLRRELSWSHYRLIMRVESPAARSFYVREAAEQNWSVRQLERSIKTLDFERRLNAPGKRDIVPTVPAKMELGDFIKDPYVLEFLDLPEPWDGHEGTLETAIIERVQHFLLELGKGFSFVGRQFRISSETSHFYVDLVFYNYLLKCFVLIDLKTSKLTHQDIGQMDMYVRMFDDLKRGEGDNPTLGIIFCADKDDTIVHYSVMKDSQQLFASKYRLILPSEEELRDELERRQILRIDRPNR
ncbi:MAG: PDDEXK nuclease domain-containing protein [Phycisphaerae bacterium]|nr:PDDEXK nuclease domain-containing protein [Phycisphaerae bacterium]